MHDFAHVHAHTYKHCYTTMHEYHTIIYKYGVLIALIAQPQQSAHMHIHVYVCVESEQQLTDSVNTRTLAASIYGRCILLFIYVYILIL